MRKYILLFTIAILFVSFSSCDKKDEEAGLEIQPDKNRLKIVYQGLNSFDSYSDVSDSLKTSKQNSSILLGSIYDDNFGKSTAFLASQFRLSTDNVDFGDSPELVSVKLYLDPISIEGDIAEKVHFKIFELENFEINPDTTYPSNIDLKESYGGLVCDYEYQPIDTATIFEIPLEASYGEKILHTSIDTLANNEIFLKAFNGLYFTVDTSLNNTGAIWKYDFNSTSTYIELKYTKLDATGNRVEDSFKLLSNEKSGRFNQFINNTSGIDHTKEFEYVSGIAGMRTHVNLSPVLTWRDSSSIMIYKAELVIKAKKSYGFSIPEKLLMEVDDNNDELNFVDDYVVNGASSFDGSYNSETEEYHMVITRHVQNLINNNHNDTLLWIFPYSQVTNPYRVLLQNGDEGNKFTLKISYSKLY